MEPLEQVTVLITLMQRLGQVMDHERAVLRSLRLDALPDLQDEKAALAEAYEIELDRLRRQPHTLAALDDGVRGKLHEAMRDFQGALTANLNALLSAQMVVEKVMTNIGQSLARGTQPQAYGAHGQARPPEPRGQVIPVAFDRKL